MTGETTGPGAMRGTPEWLRPAHRQVYYRHMITGEEMDRSETRPMSRLELRGQEGTGGSGQLSFGRCFMWPLLLYNSIKIPVSTSIRASSCSHTHTHTHTCMGTHKHAQTHTHSHTRRNTSTHSARADAGHAGIFAFNALTLRGKRKRVHL